MRRHDTAVRKRTVLERRAPPTFDVVVEIKDWDHVAVHIDVASSVDKLLRNRPLPPQIRCRNEQGEIEVESEAALHEREPDTAVVPLAEPLKHVKLYPYGVARNRLRQACSGADRAGRDPERPGGCTCRAYSQEPLSQPSPAASGSRRRGHPDICVALQYADPDTEFLAGLFDLDEHEDKLARALRETQEAIQSVVTGTRMIELAPQNAYIRRRQHELARSFDLISHSRGKEPRRRVRIYRE